MMNSILDDPTEIMGIIYLITHTASGKKYVGQTLSHRKNHNRYRPFGADGRFRDHISEALNNTKKKQCTYLNNAIRLYGADAFTVSVIETCERESLDIRECYYITEYASLFPLGYNLTGGGRGARAITLVDNTTPMNTPKKRGGCKFRSQATRQKMSARAKEIGISEESRQRCVANAQLRHMINRLKSFQGVYVNPDTIEDYIQMYKGCISVVIDGKRTTFQSKYESEEVQRNKAREFLLTLVSQATLPKCSGNP